jgi:pentatricopeptide repeat protein
MLKLLDFDVAIESLSDGFRTRVVASPGGEAQIDFVLPFTDQDLKILVLEVRDSIGRVRRKVRRLESKERRLLEDFGSRLFQAAFVGPVRECLGRSRAVAEVKRKGLRLRLRLPGELANLPWELLYDDEYGFIGLSPETALVRYPEMPTAVRPFPVAPPLRVLAMISAPTDVPELAGDEEWAKLTDALEGLIPEMVQVDRLEAGTLAALQRPLRQREYHVLHFIGHGGYDEKAQDGALALEGPDGKTRLVTGRDLGVMLQGYRSLRLVVLNACEGARSSPEDPLGGVAQGLVRQGIPAVIAMQFEISDPAALAFSQSFYQAIADGLPVDLAMVESRKAMFAQGNEVEWATPVLYMRSPDGVIFDVRKPTKPDNEREARTAEERKADERAEGEAQADTTTLVGFAEQARVQEQAEQGKAKYRPPGSPKKAKDKDLEEAIVLGERGYLLGSEGRYDEAVAVYDKLMRRFGKSSNPKLRQEVANGLVNKGVTLAQLGKGPEAISVFHRVLLLAGNKPSLGLKEHMVRAMLNKGIVLHTLGRQEEALTAYEDLLAHFGKDVTPGVAESVATALAAKGSVLASLGRSEEAIAACNEVLTRFGRDPAPELRTAVATALTGKGVVLGKLGRWEAALAIFDEMIGRFGVDPPPTNRSKVAEALVGKGVALDELGRSEDAIAVMDDVLGRFGQDHAPDVRGQTAKALVSKGVLLAKIGRAEGALAVYDNVQAIFGQDASPQVREQVVSALVNKGFTLAGLGRSEEAIGAYDYVLSRFGNEAAPGVREQLAKARTSKETETRRTRVPRWLRRWL